MCIINDEENSLLFFKNNARRFFFFLLLGQTGKLFLSQGKKNVGPSCCTKYGIYFLPVVLENLRVAQLVKLLTSYGT
jgi:hypothetical protein